MDQEPAKEAFTLRDLPVALEVMLQYVLGSYGFFFGFYNRWPIISVVMSGLSLLSYVLFAVFEFLGRFESDRVVRDRGELSNPGASALSSWRLFSFQMLVGLLILLPPLLITLRQGNLFTAR